MNFCCGRMYGLYNRLVEWSFLYRYLVPCQRAGGRGKMLKLLRRVEAAVLHPGVVTRNRPQWCISDMASKAQEAVLLVEVSDRAQQLAGTSAERLLQTITDLGYWFQIADDKPISDIETTQARGSASLFFTTCFAFTTLRSRP